MIYVNVARFESVKIVSFQKRFYSININEKKKKHENELCKFDMNYFWFKITEGQCKNFNGLLYSC